MASTRCALLALALVLAVTKPPAHAQSDVVVTVFDTGAALCTLTALPDDSWMVFDAGVGHEQNKEKSYCADAIDAAMPDGAAIGLLILSHSDADHINDAPELLQKRKVKRVVRTGFPRDTYSWCRTDYEIKVRVDGAKRRNDEKKALARCQKRSQPVFVKRDAGWPPPDSTDLNLRYYDIVPGIEVLSAGDPPAKVTILHGLHDTPDEWDADFEDLSWKSQRSRRRNAISIVAKLEHGGRSVLFTGDAVGHSGDDDPEGACIATERSLVELDDEHDGILDSDVLIAPHHGSSNGSCLEFIERVEPEWAVFSAGHDHGHPSWRAVRRYLKAGVDRANLLRTDRGDGEWGDEWRDRDSAEYGREDEVRDDDVTIILKADGSAPDVKYATHG